MKALEPRALGFGRGERDPTAARRFQRRGADSFWPRRAISEQIGGWQPQRGDKPLFGGRMGLDRAVAENVADRAAATRQGASYQEAAVAVERLAFRAHQA
jgi:hypothetical protein